MDIEKLCYDVIGAAMRIHSYFGDGYLEEVYKNALLVELKKLGFEVQAEVAIPVDYHGIRVGDYRADIIVESRLILELKAVTALNKRHEAQVVNYLTATGINDGLLLNFGTPSLQYKHKYRLRAKQNNLVNPVNPVQR
jgi:GxxExxY protein